MSDPAVEYASPVPRAVREQARRAEALARQVGMTNVPGDDGSQAPGEGQEQPGESSTESLPGDGAAPGVSDVGGAPPQPTPGGPGADGAPPDDWEQRYRVLQGKYTAETGQARGQVETLQRQIDQLHGLLATLQAAPAPAAPPAAAPTVTPEDRELWGDELPAAVGRWAGQASEARFAQLEARIQQLQTENTQLRGGQEQQGQFIARNAFEAQLDADPELGNGVWRRLNRDTPFYNWLQEVEPYSGQTRHVLLQNAAEIGDANRAATFFRSYLAEHTAPPVPPRPTPNTATNGNGSVRPAGRMRLEELAAPGRAAASGTNGGASPEARIWTNREIGAFYDGVRRGLWRGREAEQLRTEQDILTAAAQGRVTQ